MSNYHVEPVDRPQALTPEAIKSLRTDQVKGVSRRQMLRYSIGGAMALWLLEITAGTVGFIWPNLSGGFGGRVRIGTLEDVKLQNSSLPIGEGFPAYVAEARAFIVLMDPGRQHFVPGEDTSGDGSALNVRALYQRCPHLGCKPNACIRNFWLDVALDEHPSTVNPLGAKGVGESGCIAGASAVANAVEDALADRGVTVRELPITPARLFGWLGGR